jgi:hypothetical protein
MPINWASSTPTCELAIELNICLGPQGGHWADGRPNRTDWAVESATVAKRVRSHEAALTFASFPEVGHNGTWLCRSASLGDREEKETSCVDSIFKRTFGRMRLDRVERTLPILGVSFALMRVRIEASSICARMSRDMVSRRSLVDCAHPFAAWVLRRASLRFRIDSWQDPVLHRSGTRTTRAPAVPCCKNLLMALMSHTESLHP